MHPLLKIELGPQSFVVGVLWLAGWNTSTIAYVTGRTRGSIRGIVHRSLITSREKLTLTERQGLLDYLKQNRQDEGKLKDIWYIAATLDLSQRVRRNVGRLTQQTFDVAVSKEREIPLHMKPKLASPPAPAEPDLRTRAGRKEAVRRKKESDRKLLLEAVKQKGREQGGALRRGLNGSALEFLHTMLILADPHEKFVDAKRSTTSLGSRDRRKEAGLALRAFIDGCRIGGVSSVDFEREVSGSGVGLAIPAWRLECISALGAIKRMMPDRDYELIERVVDRDEFPWDDIPSVTGKKFIYEAIRRSLDVVATFQGLMARETFATRWGFELKYAEAMDHDDAVSISRQARQMFGKVQREA